MSQVFCQHQDKTQIRRGFFFYGLESNFNLTTPPLKSRQLLRGSSSGKKKKKKVNPSGADGWGSSDTPDISSPIQYSMGRFKCRLASNLITLDACRRRFKICPISSSSHVGEKEKLTSVVRWPEAYVFYLFYFPPRLTKREEPVGDVESELKL